MKISLMADEVSSDLETALELAERWGIDAVELRSVGIERFPRVSPELRSSTRRLLAEARATVIGLSPGLFKIPLPRADIPLHFLPLFEAMGQREHAAAEALLEDHLERYLPECIEAALELGCTRINCFAFVRGDALDADLLGVGREIPDLVVDMLREAAQVAARSGITLCLENEAICFGATAAEVAAIVRAVDEPNLRVTWDPANAVIAGEAPYPDGYREVAGLVGHVHFKDATVDPRTGRRHFVLDGDVDWEGQIDALRRDGYEGHVSVETHLRPRLASTEARIAKLRGLLARAEQPVRG